MTAATEGHLPPVMPQGNLVEVLGREVRKGSPGELMLETSPSRQRRPPCKTSKEMSDEAADAAALTYLLTYLYIVIVIVITTYHAVYWRYRASRADRWFLPRSIPWVPGLPEVAHSMTEDPEDRGYRSTRLLGQWQLHSGSISNGDGRWPVCSPRTRGQGTALQQHHNKQKARASLSGAKRQPRNKPARMRPLSQV